jgi:hypothetical protein
LALAYHSAVVKTSLDKSVFPVQKKRRQESRLPPSFGPI